eukprot:jgi/Mesvir1/7150/Mv02510-RA.1
MATSTVPSLNGARQDLIATANGDAGFSNQRLNPGPRVSPGKRYLLQNRRCFCKAASRRNMVCTLIPRMDAIMTASASAVKCLGSSDNVFVRKNVGATATSAVALRPSSKILSGDRIFCSRASFAAASRRHADSERVVCSVSSAGSEKAIQEEQQEEKKLLLYAMGLNKDKPRQHTLSVFVADESGLINRVSGVFARRGFNIESLAVGLNQDKALFTVVVSGTDNVVQQLTKQVYKLVNVRKVEDLTDTPRVERELLLVKVNASHAAGRSEVLELAQMFRANVVDVAEDSLTLMISGDPGKTYTFQRALQKFGIVEAARTGKVALKREPLKSSANQARMARSGAAPDAPESDSSIKRVMELKAAIKASKQLVEVGDHVEVGHDVYPMDSDVVGVWDIHSMDEGSDLGLEQGYQPHTLSILVSDSPGVLSSVTGVFGRRGYNIQSLAVGPAEKPGLSRITMVVPGTEKTITKLLRQLQRLVDVVELNDLTGKPFIDRELMLVKVAASAAERSEVLNLAQIFRAQVVDTSMYTMTVEVTGKFSKLVALQDLLRPYGIIEVARTGRVSLPRGSGVDSLYLGTQPHLRAKPV